MAMPSRNEVVKAARLSARSLLETAVATGRNVARTWEQMPSDQQARQLNQIKRAIQQAIEIHAFAADNEPARASVPGEMVVLPEMQS